jgi:hypothetical protein
MDNNNISGIEMVVNASFVEHFVEKYGNQEVCGMKLNNADGIRSIDCRVKGHLTMIIFETEKAKADAEALMFIF